MFVIKFQFYRPEQGKKIKRQWYVESGKTNYARRPILVEYQLNKNVDDTQRVNYRF